MRHIKQKKKNVLKNKMKKLLISLVQGPGVLKKKIRLLSHIPRIQFNILFRSYFISVLTLIINKKTKTKNENKRKYLCSCLFFSLN